VTNAEGSSRQRALDEEQAYVDTAYAALDRQRAGYTDRLREIRAQSGQESAGALSERDSFATHYEDNLIRLRNVENRLVLGRLDLQGGHLEHIGRIGLKNEEQDIILLDWRAPQAEPFYRATAVHPGDVIRRRHIQTRLREVTAVEDELLDSDSSADDGLNLTGEAALMAAMSQSRDGKMTDIVATIQAEQDRIIRDDLGGVLVVQGGPGTGKTAVALHRAAYLLYANREHLSRSGILVIGPSPVFLRYIDQVLPALGESDVVSTTIEGLLPGVRVTASDSAEAAEVKGRLVWRDICRRAVRELLERPLASTVRFTIDGVAVRLTPQDVDAAQRRARRGGRTHNEARDTYARQLVELLAQQVAEGRELSLADNEWIVGDVAASVDARREINLRWLPSSPTQLLERLLDNPALLASIAPQLSESDLAAIARPKGSGFTAADIAILDEMAEYLGPFQDNFERRQRAAAEARNAELSQYVAQTMSAMNLGGGIVSEAALTERMADTGTAQTLAERAAADRSWTYGHVVVDEAQELSPMQWEMLIRRCPSRSMTLVGDLDQRPAGAPRNGWKELLGRLGDRLREEPLTVSYRTPATVLNAAGRALAASGRPVRDVRAARDLPGSLETERTTTEERDAAVVTAVKRLCRELDAEAGSGGTLGVIAPRRRVAAIGDTLAAAPELAEWSLDRDGNEVSSRIHVLDPLQAKGLEYDVVVLVEPQEILADGPGHLYVAMTRPTRKLFIVHTGELPEGLAETEDASGSRKADPRIRKA